MQFKTSLLILVLFFLSFSLQAQTTINIEVNPKIELFRVVWNLAVMKKLDKDFQPAPSTYQQAVDMYFKPYKRHKAVKKLRKVWIGDYSFPYLELELNSDFSIPDERSDRLQRKIEQYGLETMQDIFLLIKDFENQSNFKAFYQKHQAYYTTMLLPLQTHFDTTIWVNEVATFFRMPAPKKINIYFDPLNNIGNSEIHTHEANVMSMAMAHIVDEIDENKRSQAIDFQVDVFTRRIFYHEATHYFSSDLTYTLVETFRPKKHLFLEENASQNVRDIVWMNQLDETIVRTITAYLFKQFDSEAKGAEELSYQTKNYPYATNIYQLLDNYLDGKNEYDSFEDFHPKIVDLILRLE